MKAARVLENNKESFILLNGNVAITREELTQQTGLNIPYRLSDFLFGDLLYEIEKKLSKLKFQHEANKFRPLVPIPDPPKIICLNFNYSDQHNWIRFGRLPPKDPIFYLKPRTCLNGPYDDVHCPAFVTQLDFEGELAVVIGKTCKNISNEDAIYVVLGYMVTNDFSARDIQYIDIQVSRSKCFDSFAPCGPWITTRSEIYDANNLRLITKVNSEIRQDSTTANMVIKIGEIISKLSRVMTLEPGDIIATGTPMGTILSSQGKKKWLQTNDIVEVEIEGLCSIRNRIVIDNESNSH
jgi:2-keto-4-pentenoate hydratase/2-oxohepta-3-ene-1,7-dioic acid hydratase in catechol pathway